jgi:ABC-2 type transport system permease protein
MTARRAIFLTTRRELRERALSRAFLISTAIQVAVVVAIVVIGAISGSDSEEFDVGVAPDARAVGEAAGAAQGNYDVTLTLTDVSNAEAARAAIADGELDAALVGNRLITDGEPDDALNALLQQASADVASSEQLRAAGVSDSEI